MLIGREGRSTKILYQLHKVSLQLGSVLVFYVSLPKDEVGLMVKRALFVFAQSQQIKFNQLELIQEGSFYYTLPSTFVNALAASLVLECLVVHNQRLVSVTFR